MKEPRQLRDARHRLLWELARNGQAQAFRQLYRELSVPAFRYAASRLRSTADAEDVTAQVFHKFVVSLDAYEPRRGSVYTWVMTMTRSTLIDHLRRARVGVPIDSVADILADGSQGPLAELIDSEEARFVHGVLARYPPSVREMFSLHFSQGLRYADIAVVLGLSEAAVKQRFARTLRELRQELEGCGQQSVGKQRDVAIPEHRSPEVNCPRRT